MKIDQGLYLCNTYRKSYKLAEYAWSFTKILQSPVRAGNPQHQGKPKIPRDKNR